MEKKSSIIKPFGGTNVIHIIFHLNFNFLGFGQESEEESEI